MFTQDFHAIQAPRSMYPSGVAGSSRTQRHLSESAGDAERPEAPTRLTCRLSDSIPNLYTLFPHSPRSSHVVLLSSPRNMSHSAGPSENHRDEESEDRIRQSPSKKPRLSVDETAPDTVHTTTATTAPRRAAQACLRCRKQKLRCLGGWPCARCIKANRECDFGKPGQHPIAAGGGGSDADPEGASARLQHLESSVADLLAGLSRSGAGAGSGTGQGVQDGWLGRQETRILPQVPVGTPDPGLAHRSYSSTSLHGPAGLSPLTDWSSSTHARARKPDAAEAAGEQSIEDNGNRVDAEERLASATREGFEPPFRALVYQVRFVPHSPLSSAPKLTPRSRRCGRIGSGRGEALLSEPNCMYLSFGWLMDEERKGTILSVRV